MISTTSLYIWIYVYYVAFLHKSISKAHLMHLCDRETVGSQRGFKIQRTKILNYLVVGHFFPTELKAANPYLMVHESRGFCEKMHEHEFLPTLLFFVIRP